MEVSEVDDRWMFPKSDTLNHPLVDDQNLVCLTHSLGDPLFEETPTWLIYEYQPQISIDKTRSLDCEYHG